MDWNIFLLFIGAAVANMLFMPMAIRLSQKMGMLDYPGNRKIHDNPVPKLGGVAILASVLVVLAFGILLFHWEPFGGLDSRKSKLGMVLGVTLFSALLGLADDLFDLKPRWKLLGQCLIAGAFAVFGYRFDFLHLPGFAPWDFSVAAVPFTVLWMVAVVNGFNFMDGVDGLAGSVTAVSLTALAVAASFLGGFTVEGMAVTLLGAVAVFTAYNKRPAKIYLGDMGASALGAFMAASLLTLGQGIPGFLLPGGAHPSHEPIRFQLFTATLLVGYPFLEVVLSTLRRGIKGFVFNRPMEWSEKEHIHHRLLKLGLGPGLICLVGVLTNSVLAFAGLLALGMQNALAVLCGGLVLLSMATLMPKLGFFDFLDLKLIRCHQPHYLVAHYFINMQRTKLGLAGHRDEIVALINQTCAEFGVQEFMIQVKANGHGNSPCRFSWERPMDVHREYLSHIRAEVESGNFQHFKDKMTIAGGDCEAKWFFEPHTEEADLDVQYRVLVGDFMKEALHRIYQLKGDYNADPAVSLNGLAYAKVGSSLLRCKHQSDKKHAPPVKEAGT